MRYSLLRHSLLNVAAALVIFSASASAATITFDTDPFASAAGQVALNTPGRQVVGGEPFISFVTGSDVFAFDAAVFGINDILFANDVAASLPTSGVNTIVLQSFDNDNDPLTPFGAGNAANLIAAQVTAPGPGFFVYFNQGLDLARLVFSTDLDDSTADLKILARMTNLSGQAGRDAFPTFTAGNFAIAQQVPEPASLLLLTSAVGAFWTRRYVLGRRARN